MMGNTLSMANAVTAVAGATVTPPVVTTPNLGVYGKTPATTDNSNSLDKNAFLKLLVAQLKYQDPMEPSSSEEFIATTAQFTIVEKLDLLTQQGAATALVSALTTASSLVGRSISAIHNGTPVDANVQRSQIVSGEVVLVTDKGDIRLDEIVSIGPPQSAAPVPLAEPADGPAPATPPAANPTTQPQETKQ